MSDLVPDLPDQVPRMGNAFSRGLGCGLLRMIGWRVSGSLPNVPKAVFAAAPHTSNWDFITAMFAIMAMGVKISYLMKKEAFFWPFKGLFMALGGIPIDRRSAGDTVGQVSDWFQKNDHVWVVITPEGTRSKVERWKTGFLRVAARAEVPVILVAWDYPTKTIHIDKLWHVGSDMDQDAEDIRTYLCGKYQGRHPDRQ